MTGTTKERLLFLLSIVFGVAVILAWGGFEKIKAVGFSTRGAWSAPGSTAPERAARTGGTLLIVFGVLGMGTTLQSRRSD